MLTGAIVTGAVIVLWKLVAFVIELRSTTNEMFAPENQWDITNGR